MADDLALDVIGQWERLEQDRQTWKVHVQECTDYIEPDRNDFIVERTPGQKRMRKVFDGTPIWCNQQFGAGMHSLLTSPTLPWGALTADDDHLNTIPRVRLWLQQASAAMMRVFNSTHNGFATNSAEIYHDLGAIGQGVMFTLEARDRRPIFLARHPKECVFAENEEEKIDSCIRNWRWTAKQAIDQWGRDAVGEKIRLAKPETKFTFLHAIRPRRQRDPARAAEKLHMAWESVYVAVDERLVIAVGGFPEFPIAPPRFSRLSGETNGRGPGMLNLADIKMLNEMAKLVVKAAQKVIDPPLMIPDNGFITGVKTVPGSQNFYRAGTRDRIEAVETKGDIKLGIELINALREQIKRGFYVDLLRLPVDMADPASSGKGSTATYWSLYQSKEFLAMSPLLSRMNSEFTGPVFDRLFAMMWRRSVALKFGPGSPFPAPPPELQGAKLNVEYLSPIAVAQKTSQLDSVGRLIQMQMTLRQMDPDMPISLSGDGIMRGTGDDLNAPAWAFKTPMQLQQEIQQKQQAQAQQAHAAMLAQTAGAAKDGGAAIASLAAARANGGGGGGDPAQQLQQAA